MRVPINITGGTYQSRSRSLSNQRTVNLYPELIKNPAGKESFVLHSTPGYKLFGGSGATGSDRGMLEHKGVLYKVSGITLYSVDINGTDTSLGTVQGSLPVVMRGFGDNVVIATGEGKAYQYNGTTTAEITDTDLESPTWLDAIGGHVLFGGQNGRFWVSASGDATDINGLDFATAEIDADDLIRGYVFKEQVYLFGDKTTEVWWQSGVGRPPFDRVRGASINEGIAGRMAVTNNDRSLYWLGNSRRIYQNGQIVSDIGLANKIENYATVSDAKMQALSWENQNFIILTFPSENKTFLYPEGVGMWFEMAIGTGRSPVNSHAFAYGKNLVSDYRNSNIYHLDINTFTEAVNPLLRSTGDNLVTDPEDLGGAGWTVIQTPVITANTDTAPNGTVTADTIEDNHASLAEGVYEDITIAPANHYVYSWFVEKDTVDRETRFAQLGLTFTPTTETNRIFFDTSNGDYSLETGSTDVDGGVIDFNKNWWLVWLSGQSTNQSNTTARCYLYPSRGAYSSQTWLIDGTITGSIVAWRGDLREGRVVETSQEIQRFRDSGVLSSKLLGYSGSEVEIHRVELNIERGEAAGDPVVSLQVSRNGGKTFGTETWRKIGKQGNFNQQVVYGNMGRGEEIVFRVKCSEDILFSVHSMFADIEPVI